jgi:hypothetical protein
VTHPYGTGTCFAEAENRNINFTEDIGCAAAPCDFPQAGATVQVLIDGTVVKRAR